MTKPHRLSYFGSQRFWGSRDFCSKTLKSVAGIIGFGVIWHNPGITMGSKLASLNVTKMREGSFKSMVIPISSNAMSSKWHSS